VCFRILSLFYKLFFTLDKYHTYVSIIFCFGFSLHSAELTHKWIYEEFWQEGTRDIFSSRRANKTWFLVVMFSVRWAICQAKLINQIAYFFKVFSTYVFIFLFEHTSAKNEFRGRYKCSNRRFWAIEFYMDCISVKKC
jgi:hypothetical protein